MKKYYITYTRTFEIEAPTEELAKKEAMKAEIIEPFKNARYIIQEVDIFPSDIPF